MVPLPREGTRLAAFAGLVRAAFRVDRDLINTTDSSRAALGVALPLVGGILLGHTLIGVAAAAGALFVGFVSFQGTYRGKLAAVLAATVGMGLSTFLGGLAAHAPVAEVLLTVVGGFAAGLLVAVGPAATVTGIQCVLALLVVSQFSLTPTEAGWRALEVMGGGLVQALLVVLPWPLRRFPAERRAVSAVYAALSAYAEITSDAAAAPPETATIAAARRTLADPQPFAANDSLMMFASLVAEADRIRTSLASIAEMRSRSVAPQVAGTLAEVTRRTARLLAEVADATAAGTTIPSAERSLRDLDELSRGLRETAPPYVVDQVQALLGQLRSVRRLGESMSDPARAAAPTAVSPRRAGSPVRDAWLTIRATFTPQSTAFRHATRLAGTLGVASTAYQLMPSAKGYWLPLTVLVVLRPDFAATVSRGSARIIGTLVSAALATLLVASVHLPELVLAALVIAAAGLGYSLFQASYALYSACITAYIVFLLAFTGQPELRLVLERGLDTVAGGALALVAYLAFPTWESSQVPRHLAVLLRAQGAYAREVLLGHADPASGDMARRMELRNLARLARSNAEASVARMLVEPHRPREVPAESAVEVLSSVRRFALAALTLHAGRPAPDAPPGPPETARLAEGIATQLDHLATLVETGAAPGPAPQLRPMQVALAARFGLGEALPAKAPEGGGDVDVPLLVVETDVLVDAANSIRASLSRAPSAS